MFWAVWEQLPPNTMGVPIFSPVHLCWLLGAAVLACAASVLFRRAAPNTRQRLLRGISALNFILLLLRLALYWYSGVFTPVLYLPLHLCDVMVLVEFLAVFLPSGAKGPLAALCWWLGLPGALFALVTPGETAYPFWNIYYLIFLFLHFFLLLIPLLLVLDGFRPRLHQTPFCFLWLLGLAAVAFFVNRALGSNYLFLARAPGGSILELLQKISGPGYLLAMMALCWAVWLLQHLLFLGCSALWRNFHLQRKGKTLL